VSSIFMALEFGVQVWAVDRGVDPSDNMARVVERGCEGAVFPVRADARALPFAHGFFDAVVALDSYLYFGTDDRAPYRWARERPDRLFVALDSNAEALADIAWRAARKARARRRRQPALRPRRA
jgi:cyclopropane fatty-acyl-phospholipid synthase-like methyltransferase